MKDKMNIIGIIPARMASMRFPGKPLAKICGIPMIEHVYFRSKMAGMLCDVYIATCDREIEEYCIQNNMKVVMTKDTHQRASDRTAEAMLKIEEATKERIDIVVMVQGDEPMVYPEMINQAVKPMLENDAVVVVNLMAPIRSLKEHQDPNAVKVVVDKDNFALYFSREPIPSRKKYSKEIPMNKQISIDPFRRDFLIKFNNLPSTPLEVIESIDMLRVLGNGYRVKMVPTESETYSVDTLEDLKRVERFMENDSLIANYKDVNC